MRNVRTDLALEARELAGGEILGVASNMETILGHRVHRVEVLDKTGSMAIGKPIGNYITIELSGIAKREDDVFSRAIRTLSDELARIMPEGGGDILVVGLGNRGITPDAVGDAVVSKVMVTRHLVEKLPEYFASFRPVSAIVPGVLGMTGVESKEIIAGVAEKIKPSCIIVVDALASRKISRLCNTIQITDTGITPGSGVGNSRATINRETMGVPVIAVGVPTVVDISSIILDIEEECGISLPESITEEYGQKLMVTPKEIDVNVEDVAKIIGYAINLSLHPKVSIEDMDMFLS
ncbi:MAG: GPR endopeptidase [Clostridia bacterium]|nr:GPR endopeptidase [Clostridia bacterium]